MNRHKLERWLKDHGCHLERHGGGHDIWMKEGSIKGVPVPRHNEIKSETVASICRSFGISKPSGK